MQIIKSSSSDFTISGDIKTISDYQLIKQELQGSVDGGINAIDLRIPDSQTVTSSVVGYFLKLVNLNNIKVTLHIGNPKLHKMLEDLVLIDVFNVKKA